MTGLTIPRYFTQEGRHPFDTVDWEFRDAVIVAKEGKPVFEACGVEFPAFWSQQATDIVASKYFRVVREERETSVRQLIGRIGDAISLWSWEDGYFSTEDAAWAFKDELLHILLNQYASFNSPVWFNVGVQECPQTAACYILDVDDSMESILEWYRQEGMIFKYGSGAGVNLSKIRAKGSPLSSGGIASGVMSFAHVADANAGAIKSGGSTRRAAKLLVLDIDHPEIEDFIRSKCDAEKLARTLMALGYGNGIEGGAYDQVPWQNANNSVSVSDDFMACTTMMGEEYSGELFHKIAEAAWECGCPGLQFADTINAWHTTPGRGRIVSSNPCGEFLRPPNEACNLASLNLLKFLNDDGSFDIPAFTHIVDIMITAMDILIDRSSYPTEVIAQNSRDYRPLGLGYTNLGALLMAKGVPYDSDEGRNYAAAITALLTGQAYKRSAELAEVRGAFTGYAQNCDAMCAVIGKHSVAAHALLDDLPVPDMLILKAYEVWQHTLNRGARTGFRNCQVSVLAPCGTISFMMDCDTTGIEPCLGLVTTKKLVGGGEITLVNGVVDRALQSLGFMREDERQVFREMMTTKMPDRLFLHKDVFATALGDNRISWQGHIKMVAAVQPFITGGISKTVNLPHDAPVQDVFDAYLTAWKIGLKAISIYRDGSKGVQPVTVGSTQGKTLSDAVSGAGVCFEEELREPFTEDDGFISVAPQRHRLSDERQSITHKFMINTHEGYLTVGLYGDGSPGELFVRMAKEGSTLGGIMDAWATVVSIALQYGVPLDVLVAKFTDGQYEPRGFTSNPEIRTASSITDYIVRWMELKFLRAEIKPTWALIPGGEVPDLQVDCAPYHYKEHVEKLLAYSTFAQPLCSECGNMTIRNGSCGVCTVCGTTTGCS